MVDTLATVISGALFGVGLWVIGWSAVRVVNEVRQRVEGWRLERQLRRLIREDARCKGER